MRLNRYDLLFAAVLLLVFLPFFLIRPLYEVYETFNSAHGMVMSFIKFALLSTLGEMLGARISRGRYCPEGFGVVPKMIVWGILGMGINMAMIIFSNGVPVFLEYMGYSDAGADFAGGLTWGKVLVAFCISVAMNSIFAPVFMTLHKITDIHIADNKGSLKALIRPIPMAAVFSRIDWKAQWGFVFKKTIPLFWFPAHTVTFLLPAGARPLFAALLGVVLGVLLAVAGRKK